MPAQGTLVFNNQLIKKLQIWDFEIPKDIKQKKLKKMQIAIGDEAMKDRPIVSL